MLSHLKVNKKTIGVITFVSAESKRSFNQADLQFAQQLAHRSSIAIENANLYQAVRVARKRLDNIVANVPGVVWEAWGHPSADEQRIDFVSSYVEKMLGYTVLEWLSTPNFWLKIVHPEDKERAAKEAEKIFKSGRGGISEFRWVGKDGRVFWVEAQSRVVKDENGNPLGMRGVTIDISQRKKDERGLEQLAAIVETSDDAILTVDLKGFITSWNPGAENLYGYSARESIGKHISSIIPKERIEEFSEIMEIIGIGEGVDHLETVRKRKDGRLTDVSLTISPLRDARGNVIGASTIARNISVSKELERRKDAFIGMASHELKTPITTLKAFTQVLQKRFESSSDDLSKKFLLKMNDQLNRLTDLITDLLDLSKIQSNKLELDKQMFNINDLVKETIEDIQSVESKHKIILENGVDAQVKGDKDRISQVMTNLITNAIKYSPQNDKVVVKLEFKSKGQSVNPNNIVISVQDFGIGISKTHQKRIFDRFYRAAGVSEKTFPGLGIGLYISSEIVRRHGGNIWVESIKRKGSTFSFSLPLK
ncbi:PAS domain S-box protein [Candidatus Daviesbacteria bacterium]|nr:PAS domain S-box protein [Candidatus Daviesbacteria bacterium]